VTDSGDKELESIVVVIIIIIIIIITTTTIIMVVALSQKYSIKCSEGTTFDVVSDGLDARSVRLTNLQSLRATGRRSCPGFVSSARDDTRRRSYPDKHASISSLS